MLKGALASIVIALALFLLYDVSQSFYAPCVAQPAAENRPPELCGLGRSMTAQAMRFTVATFDHQQGALTAAAAIALTIIGAIIAVFTGEIAWATRHSAEFARRSAEHLPRLERGYLFVSAADKSTWVSADNERMMVAIDIRNYGRTPAILIESYGEFLSAPPDVKPAKYLFGSDNKQIHSVVLAPGAPALRLDDRFFGQFVDPAFFIGYVKYRDAFRTTHVSCWCLRSKRTSDGGWQWEPAGVAGWDDYD